MSSDITPPSYDEKKIHSQDVEKTPATEIADGTIVENKLLEHAGDADDAMKAFTQAQGDIVELDEETNRRLLRKIDWNLMPMMCAVYMLNFLDKTSISYASVMGIKKDINLKGDDYQWLGKDYIGFTTPGLS